MQRPRGLRLLVAALLLSRFLCPAPAAAQGAPAAAAPAEVEEAIQSTLQIMEAETEIATASRINADYVPGILTVLRGSDLEERGLLTVFDALALVPGLNLSMTASGEKRVIVRGVGSTFAPSTLKYLLNGVSVNSSLDGKASVVFDVPIEQVERIEIIRGPGTTLYGEFANAGVIHVITRQSENRFFGRSASFNTWAGGGAMSLGRARSGLDLSLNVAAWNTDGGSVTVEKDKLSDSRFAAFSRAPGPTNEDHQNITGVFSLGYRKFALSAQYTESRFGDYFGFAGVLPPPEDRKVQVNSAFTLEATQGLSLTPTVGAEARLGWCRTSRSREAELLPPGIQLSRRLVLEDGLVEDMEYAEDRLFAQADLKARVRNAHAILLGANYSWTGVSEASLSTNGTAETWIDEATTRGLASAYLQDEFEVSDRFSVTGGVRYDNYDDQEDHVTPRISGVYRIRDRHIFKIQYAEGFRPPTFIELNGRGSAVPNPDLKPETIRTYEAGYIFKSLAVDTRLTLFYSELDKLIIPGSIGDEGAATLVNSDGAISEGSEAELLWRVGRFLTVTGNVSYVKTRDNETGEDIEGSADWLGNLDLTYQPSHNASFVVYNRYVGNRHRGADDTRGDLGDYDTVDLVCNLYHWPGEGFTLRAGVKNVFDALVVYPSFASSFSDDYARPGRQWWAQISYSF